MKNLTPLVPFIILAITCCTPTQKEKEAPEWIQLFNGKDLSGWKVKISGHELGDNYNHTFRVEDSLLKVSYDQYDSFRNEFGHLFYEKPFSFYRIRVEYRFVGEQTPGGPSWGELNSGVMLHSQSPESMEKNQNFPISIELQLLAAYDTLERTNANLATPGTHVVKDGELYTDHMMYSDSKPSYNGEWVTAEAIVLGDSIIHYLVGSDTVLTFTHPQIGGWELENEMGWVEDKTYVKKMKGAPLKEGYIALQAESHPVEFRKVELLDLSDEYK